MNIDYTYKDTPIPDFASVTGASLIALENNLYIYQLSNPIQISMYGNVLSKVGNYVFPYAYDPYTYLKDISIDYWSIQSYQIITATSHHKNKVAIAYIPYTKEVRENKEVSYIDTSVKFNIIQNIVKHLGSFDN